MVGRLGDIFYNCLVSLYRVDVLFQLSEVSWISSNKHLILGGLCMTLCMWVNDMELKLILDLTVMVDRQDS